MWMTRHSLRVSIFHLGSYFYQTLSNDIARKNRERPGAFLVHWVIEAILGGQSFSAQSPELELTNVRGSSYGPLDLSTQKHASYK